MKLHLVLFLYLLCLFGCTTKSDAESQAFDAFERGIKEGKSKGFEEGHNEGYKKGYDEGYDKGYNEGYEKGCDETQTPLIEEKHGYRESTHPVTCPNCGGDGFINGISKKEICPACNMSGVIQVKEKEFY